MPETRTPAKIGPAGPPPLRTREREFTIKERTQTQIVLGRFLRHRVAVLSLIVLLIIIVFAYVVQRLWPHDYRWFEGPSSMAPSLDYLMGTDELGHDYFAKVMRGAEQSLNVALLVALLSTMIGAPFGAIAGYYGGRVDMLMMRFVDVLLTLPFIAIAGMLAFHFQGRWYVVALILGLLGWVVNARVVRGVVLSLREQEFVEAARALGASDTRIIFRHLLPNVTGAVIVQATLDIAGAILGEAALSFIGLGIHPPDTSLGLLTNEAQEALTTRPWLFYAPGLTIILIALTINFIGDGLRDALDPRQTRQRR